MFFLSTRCFQQSSNTKILVFASLFIALNIIFTHILAIQTPFLRISFGFLPVVIFSALYGALKGAVVAGIADILGCFIFSPGLFFPGFTLSACCSGWIYGLFFYNKKITLPKIILATAIVFLTIDIALDTLWLEILYHRAFQVFLVGRLIKSFLFFPIQVIITYTVFTKKVDNNIERY